MHFWYFLCEPLQPIYSITLGDSRALQLMNSSILKNHRKKIEDEEQGNRFERNDGRDKQWTVDVK